VAQTRRALEELSLMVADVRAAAAELPAEADARIAEIRAAIEKGLADLTDAAKRTASDTQAIDAAFQDRVRRNYEMLSEAVQLMGVVAQGGQGAAVLKRPVPKARDAPESAPPPVPPPTAAPPSAASPVSEPPEPVARPRIKFTAVAAETAPAPEPEAIAPAEKANWSWKSLLTPLGGDAAAVDGGPALFREIVDMGIDPAALLSRRRVEEIAVAIQTGDTAGGREVVRNLAPAAVRRLTRRLTADAGFLQRGRDYVHAFWALLEEAKRRDRQGFEATGLLASDQGRAFLLLDVAGAESGGWR